MLTKHAVKNLLLGLEYCPGSWGPGQWAFKTPGVLGKPVCTMEDTEFGLL